MVRVVIVAPLPAMRAGLRALLGADVEIAVVGEAAGLSELSRLLPTADVLVLMGGAATLDWPAALQETGDSAPALLLATDDASAAAALAASPARAWGLVPLEVSAEELTAGVRAVNAGLIVGLPALLAPLLAGRLGASGRQLDPLAEPLTAREAQVLQLLAQGLANKQIAAALGISEHTVKFHVSSIYAKLGATSRTEAVRLGAARGLIVLWTGRTQRARSLPCFAGSPG